MVIFVKWLILKILQNIRIEILDTVYDDHYQSTDYFGKPLPELIEYFTTLKAKVKILKSIVDGSNVSKIVAEKMATYIFEDKTSDHVSHSPYRILVVEKR